MSIKLGQRIRLLTDGMYHDKGLEAEISYPCEPFLVGGQLADADGDYWYHNEQHGLALCAGKPGTDFEVIEEQP